MNFFIDGDIWHLQLPDLSYDSGYTNNNRMQEKRNKDWERVLP